MVRKKGERSIRDVLREREQREPKLKLYHSLEVLWQTAEEEIHPRQRSPDGHKTGTEHCQKVEDNLNKLIPDKDKLEKYKPIELFILSASACLHDVGKAVESKVEHGTISMVDIITNHDKYGLNEGQAVIIGKIASAHDDDTKFDELDLTEPLEGETLELRHLAALLKLADVLHTYYTRVPRILLGIPKDKVENEKTRFRKLVHGWDFDEDGEVFLQAYPENEEDIRILLNGVAMMNEEINHVTPYLKEGGYPTRIYLKPDPLIWKLEEERKVKGFVGMDSLTEKDIFKGRDKEAVELSGKVAIFPIVLLVGDSGVGKTSLINAGLFPMLKWFKNWRYALTRPFDAPLRDITEGIRVQLLSGAATGAYDLSSTIQTLSRAYQGKSVLVVVDQFEDAMRAPKSDLQTLGIILRSIETGRFSNIRVLIAYRSEAEAQIAYFLQEHIGRIPEKKLPLTPLDKAGAKEALRSGFEAEEVGIEDNVLLEEIILDLEKESEFVGKGGVYPPFIQMVGSTLCNKVKEKESIVTGDLYEDELGRAGRIIGNYLFNQLDEFGTMRTHAEEILKKLVYEGKKAPPKSKTELSADMKIEDKDLHKLLDMMIRKRMIRPLGDLYEIIHDYLAERVEKELVTSRERPLRHALHILESKSASYKIFWNLLTPVEMAVLYSSRKDIENEVEQNPRYRRLILHSCLAGQGPTWWWFRNSEKSEYLLLIVEGLKSKAQVEFFRSVKDGAVEAFKNVVSPNDLPLIKDMLKDDYVYVRKAAVEAFAKLGSHDDLPLIKEMLKDEDGDVRQAAVAAISTLGSREDLPEVKALLKNGDWNVREATLKAIFKLVSREDLPLVRELLRDKEENVRRAAVDAFSQLASREDLPLVRELIKDKFRYVRMAAIQAISTLGSREDVPLVRELLYDKARGVRMAAIQAIPTLGSREDLPLVRELLNDEAREVRKAALEAFSKFLSRESLPEVRVLLNDENWEVRMAAIQAIPTLGSREDLPLVRELLNDEYWAVQSAALEAFSKLVSHDDLPLIKEMLKDEDGAVRNAAVEAFGKLVSHDDLLFIKEMLKDEDGAVRAAAVEAFSKLGDDDELMLLVKLVAEHEIDADEVVPAVISMDRRFYCPFKWVG